MSTQGPSGLDNPANYLDDDDQGSSGSTKGLRKKEFECPECTAHNPYDDGFGVGDQVRCYYCGAEFDVLESDGKFKYREA